MGFGDLELRSAGADRQSTNLAVLRHHHGHVMNRRSCKDTSTTRTTMGRCSEVGPRHLRVTAVGKGFPTGLDSRSE